MTIMDKNKFWDKSYDHYICPKLKENSIEDTEGKIGYKLPELYKELIKVQNGGIPSRTCFRTEKPTSWAEDHIEISSLSGIGGSEGIEEDSEFMIEEWGYPNIGIVICQCPSAGHDAVMLDYSKCGKNGEPQVIHVDVEIGEITVLASNFKTFIDGLVSDEEFYD